METLAAANGCDSVVTINLVFVACTCNNITGDLSFTISGNNTSGDYTQLYALTTPTGEILALSSNPEFLGLSDGTYFVYSINYETSGGISGNTVGSNIGMVAGGCIEISGPLVYVVQIPTLENVNYTGCEGDGYSVSINGNTYDENTPTGTETLIGQSGCDSVIITINLIFLPNATGTETYTGCTGDGYSAVSYTHLTLPTSDLV